MDKTAVTLLTEARYINPVPDSDYVKNIFTEDGLVRCALEKRGLTVKRVNWADTSYDWSSTRCALFRTTWDYFYRFGEFSEWLKIATAKTDLINPAKLIYWNIDKHYLRDLERRGVSIPPTRFVEPREKVTLEDLHKETGWKETILKPAISGTARHTYRLNPENRSTHETIFQELIAKESMLLQPYFKKVQSHGEIALMVMDGKFTHAILKKAKPGDFRVQDDFGGTVHHYTPTRGEIAFAERVVSVCDPAPAYARVDVILDDDGRPCVGEVELIEPELWFRFAPEAAEKLADAVVKRLK